MIHWLIQSLDSHPALRQGQLLAGLLNAKEWAYFNSLKVNKRRQDWLLGRWTAKRLVQTVLQERWGETVPFPEITVWNYRSGAPFAQVAGETVFSLTMSHSGDYGFCGVMEQADWPLGVDIEFIETRRPVFVKDYFTSEEQRLIESASTQRMRDTVITAMWSAKEAALKAVHLGLRVDTRSVTCLIQPLPVAPYAWQSFEVYWNFKRLGRDTAPPVRGWWQLMEGGEFVLTMVAAPEDYQVAPSAWYAR